MHSTVHFSELSHRDRKMVVNFAAHVLKAIGCSTKNCVYNLFLLFLVRKSSLIAQNLSYTADKACSADFVHIY